MAESSHIENHEPRDDVISRAWVQVAHSGQEALEQYRESHPELVLMDLRLQDVDGWTLAPLMMAQRREPLPLFVAVSGLTEAEDLMRAREVGFEQHLSKPVEPTRLFGLIAQAFERRAPVLK